MEFLKAYTFSKIEVSLLNFRWTKAAAASLQPKTMGPYLNISSSTTSKRRQFFNENMFTDVTLTCGGKEFKCSSMVLAENSLVFEKMFTILGYRESCTNSAIIPGIDDTTFEKVIRFLYSGYIELQPSNVLEVFNFANQYDVTPLRHACGDYLFEKVTPESVMNPLWMTAKMFNSEKLSQACLNYCLENFTQVLDARNFLKCDEEMIYKLIVHTDIQIAHERDVMNAICDWMAFDQPNRVTKATKLLNECLRKEFLDEEDIFEIYHRYEEEMSDVTHAALSRFTVFVSFKSKRKRNFFKNAFRSVW